MNRHTFVSGMHRLYRSIYAEHGNKDAYTADELLAIVDSTLRLIPDAFQIDQASYRAPEKKIVEQMGRQLQMSPAIDTVILRMVLTCLRESGVVSRFFPLKIAMWSLFGPLRLAPD